jgi:predicted RNase H-like HicB family nuclease
MDTNALNYRVIIEPDVYSGSGKPCYLAYASALDVADNGDTIEEAITHITEAIRCRIDALIVDGEPVPSPDDPAETVVVTTAKVEVPKDYPFAFS